MMTVHAEPPQLVPGEGFLPRWEAGRPLELPLRAAEKAGSHFCPARRRLPLTGTCAPCVRTHREPKARTMAVT